MDFTQGYNRTTWNNFLENSFLPDDFDTTEEIVPFSGTFSKKVTKLGVCPSLNLSVFEIEHSSTHDARVGLSKEAFTLVRDYTEHNKALVLFVPQSSRDNYRFSFVEFTPTVDKTGKLKRNISNPRRYSYILGKDAKVKTPQQYLLKKDSIKDSEELKKRFSVEVLTKEFYNYLFNWYDNWAIKVVKFPSGSGKEVNLKTGEQNRIHLIRLITRFIFVWFIKQKKLIPDWIFDKEEVSKVLKNFKSDSLTEGNYYNGIIQNLFFATLNKPIKEREFAYEKATERKEDYGIKTKYRDTPKISMFSIEKEDFISHFDTVPFLNGGLFECLDNFDTKEYIDGFSREDKRRAFIPNALFWGNENQTGLIELFETYNFTIEENTPQDIDVALDPELLGKVFENLLGTFNQETSKTARNESGSFYTPREIVDYMVDTSLKEYLKSKLNTGDKSIGSKLDDLFSFQHTEHDFTTDQIEIIMQAINQSKILDPACGSGAFPMGILNKLSFVMQKLDPKNAIWKKLQIDDVTEKTRIAYGMENKEKREKRLNEIKEIFEMSTGIYSNYARKLFLIENCIYGVDIQPIAIQISKLRFFISLIVDQKTDDNMDNNYNVLPLPNLETKFVAANTLIGVNKLKKGDQGLLISDEIGEKQNELLIIRHNHFTARDAKEKIDLRKQDEVLCKELVKLLKNDGFFNSTDAALLAKWNPYNQSEPADFFDPTWMFGLPDKNTSLNSAGFFDIVIGNPPYVQIKQIPWNDRRLFESIYKTATGRFNLFYLFLEKSTELTKINGISSFIIPDRIMLNTQCSNLRELLLNEQMILEIDSFDDSVFDSAVVDSVILLYQNNKSKYRYIKTKNKANINMIMDMPSANVPFEHFTNSPSNQFDISYNEVNSSIVNKMQNNSLLLGEIAEIKDGIIQGKVTDLLFLKKKFDAKSKKTSVWQRYKTI